MLILYSLLLLSFVFLSSGAHRDLPVLTHSFPTRRSSELAAFQHAGALVQFVAKLVRQARRGNRATDRPAETIPCPRGQRRERCRAEAPQWSWHARQLTPHQRGKLIAIIAGEQLVARIAG